MAPTHLTIWMPATAPRCRAPNTNGPTLKTKLVAVPKDQGEDSKVVVDFQIQKKKPTSPSPFRDWMTR